MVRSTGLEPARLAAYAPQTYVSTNSTTTAQQQLIAGGTLRISGSELKPQAEKRAGARE